MKALITGITGFAGSHLAELLVKKNYEVSGTFFTGNIFPHNLYDIKDKIQLHKCDIRNQESLKMIIRDFKPDEIYHLAAISFVPSSIKDPKLSFATNLCGTLNLYEIIKDMHLCPLILFVGSSDEYGIIDKKNLPINEQHPLNPQNPYSISKTSADFLSNFYYRNYGMRIIRVRAFNHIGPGQSPDFVCSNFARQIAENEKRLKNSRIIVGNLESSRDFTDVRDMVRAYWLALKKGIPGEVYNICSEKEIQVKQLLKLLLKISSKKMKVVQNPNKIRKSDTPAVKGDATKFKNKTGWKTLIPLEKTLRDMLVYWRHKIKK